MTDRFHSLIDAAELRDLLGRAGVVKTAPVVESTTPEGDPGDDAAPAESSEPLSDALKLRHVEFPLLDSLGLTDALERVATYCREITRAHSAFVADTSGLTLANIGADEELVAAASVIERSASLFVESAERGDTSVGIQIAAKRVVTVFRVSCAVGTFLFGLVHEDFVAAATINGLRKQIAAGLDSA